mmetsp:Transcript_53072/g.98181  ORF Transcript_53072/g.98181 Transcript_53072/m.98181 type:complete len:407 (+) Transcript_53072:43-1263(+)
MTKLAKLLMMAAAIVSMLSSTRAFLPGLPRVHMRAGSVRPRVQLRAVDPWLAGLVQSLWYSATYDRLKASFQSMTEIIQNEQFVTIDERAKDLADKLAKEGTHVSGQATRLPKLVVEDTAFQLLLRSVLDSSDTEGTKAIYAEPCAGKSVAVALEVLRRKQAKEKSDEIVVLLAGNFEDGMKEFFGINSIGRLKGIADATLFVLEEKGKKLIFILDDMFSVGVQDDKVEAFLDLARAVFAYGHALIVITQSEVAAREVAFRNGDRTDLAIQQVDFNENGVEKGELRIKDKATVSESSYRWTEEQARLFFKQQAALKAVRSQIAPEEPEESNPIAKWYKLVQKEFDQSENVNTAALQSSVGNVEAAVDELLTEAQLEDLLEQSRCKDVEGGWLPGATVRVWRRECRS